MNNIITIEKALAVVNKLKAKYNFGKPECPDWFRSISTAKDQDGGYNVNINIPTWNALTFEESAAFLQMIDGVWVGLRVVSPPTYKYKDARRNIDVKKPEEAVDDKKPITKIETPSE